MIRLFPFSSYPTRPSSRRVLAMPKVRKLLWFVIVSFWTLSAELLGSTGIMVASAQEAGSKGAAAQAELRGRDILVAGGGAVADGKSPAVATIDFGERPVSPQASLQLLLSPVAVSPNEPYLLLVTVKGSDGEKRVGSGTFFPPRLEAIQSFFFNVSPILAEMKAQKTNRVNLSIALVPVDRNRQLTNSAVRLVGARLVSE